MPAPNFSEPLAWEDSPLENPLAIYDVDFTTSIEWIWQSVKGEFGKVELRAKFVCIDNLDANQFLNAYFDNVRYPVNAFQRLTLPVPPNARQFSIVGDASSLLQCEVSFAVDDISFADTINFKAVQSSGTEGVLWPIFYKAGPWNFIGSDDHTIQSFTIAGAIAVQLPDPTTVSNGWTIQIWNEAASTANITLTAPGATIDGAANLIIAPNTKVWFALDGANAFTVVKTVVVNPTVQYFTAGGTWTPTRTDVELDYIEVEGVGGGGAGGGALNTGRAQGGGGGSGAWGIKKILAASLNLAGETVTIGAAGAPGAAGNNPGGNGGTTSFGAHMSLTGGNGGAGSAGGSPNSANGGTGGTPSGHDFGMTGQTGEIGFGSAASVVGKAGNGASNPLGFGGMIAAGATGNGVAGVGRGAGGSGGNDLGSSINRSGGAGTAGAIIVREYYK